MRVLIFDLELAPNIAYVWGKYEQTAIDFLKERSVISVAWKWSDEKKVHCRILPDYKEYKGDPYGSGPLIRDFYEEYCKADMVVAHNGRKFDQKALRTEFLRHGLRPPPPMKVIDTLLIAKRVFRFNSNKLDDLGKFLGLGAKMKHEGFELWLKCLNGNKSAWERMRKYNVQDVRLLEKLWHQLRAWDESHPDLAAKDRNWNCPSCGSVHAEKRGWSYAAQSRRRRLLCLDCGRWFQGIRQSRKKH